VYVANPYMMFTAYERTAYAELLAAAWIPLLLAAILRDRVTVPRLAIPVALLWLTNAPAAVMGCYALAFLAAVRLVGAWSEQSQRSAALKTCLALAGRVAAGVVLGLGVAAFYVLPAAYERRWVQIAMAMVTGMRIEDNFLFHHTSDAAHDEVLHTASLIAVMLLVAAVVVFWLVLLRTRKDAWGRSKQPRFVSLTLLAATIGLLLTPLSAAVWRVAPEMAFLQFPWRLCAILSALVCAGLGWALRDVRFRRGAMSVGALLLVIFIGFPSIHVFRQECDPEDTVSARLATFVAKAGTDPTDEYTPGNDDNDGLAHTNPPYWLARDGEEPAPTSNSLGPVPMHFAVDAQTPGTLVLNLREYPLWQVRVNGVPTTSLTERSDGLIAIPVSPGHVQIDIAKVTTWDRRLGEEISGVSLSGLALIGLAKRRTARSRIIED
jgi:hypothetical protein